MDVLALLHRARDTGLRLEVDGTTLKITGPKEAEPLVRLLAEHKTQVLEVLANDGLRKLRELRKIAPESPQGDLPQSVEEESRCDREHDETPYASALAALRAKCPVHVPEDLWQQAIADATTFISEWGARAEALGWTSADLFGLHTPPEKPAPSYRRLSRYDQTGLIWLLRGRSVIALTSTEAVILCHSGATLKFCRSTEAALAEITKVTPAAEITEVAPAKEIDSAVALYRPTKVALAEITETITAMAQVGNPTPVRIIDTPVLAKQGLGDAPTPPRRNADAANHAEATHLIPEDLSIPEFLRREKDDIAGKAAA